MAFVLHILELHGVSIVLVKKRMNRFELIGWLQSDKISAIPIELWPSCTWVKSLSPTASVSLRNGETHPPPSVSIKPLVITPLL